MHLVPTAAALLLCLTSVKLQQHCQKNCCLLVVIFIQQGKRKQPKCTKETATVQAAKGVESNATPLLNLPVCLRKWMLLLSVYCCTAHKTACPQQTNLQRAKDTAHCSLAELRTGSMRRQELHPSSA